MRASLCLLLVSLSFVSCKKKVIVENTSGAVHSANSGPTLQSGEWHGEKDVVDPSLGSLKNLD